jgi:hypothetical protein
VTFIETRLKRAKDLTSTDVARIAFRNPVSRFTNKGWTEVLEVYAGYEGYDQLSRTWDGIPDGIDDLADKLNGSVSYVVIRVVVPGEACKSGEMVWSWVGLYGFDLVEVQSEPVVLPYSEPVQP